MIHRILNAAALPFVLAAALSAGCQAEIAPTNAERARETLVSTLDAWKSGETAEAYTARSSVTAIDSKWQAGTKLVGYEVLGDGQMDGFDWQLKVRLSLKDSKGKSFDEKAIYNVSTTPALVVVRNEN